MKINYLQQALRQAQCDTSNTKRLISSDVKLEPVEALV